MADPLVILGRDEFFFQIEIQHLRDAENAVELESLAAQAVPLLPIKQHDDSPDGDLETAVN